DESEYMPSYFFAFFLLEEMARAVNRYLGLGGGCRDQGTEESVAPRRDRVPVGEHHQRRLMPLLQLPAGFAHMGGAVLIGLYRHEAREHLGARLVRGVRKRSVVGRHCLVGDERAVGGAASDDLADGKIGSADRIVAPFHEALGRRTVAGREP